MIMNTCLGLLCLVAAQVQASPPPMTPVIQAQNLACGLPPLPPLGCQVGPCVCDEHGRNCRWTFICN